MTGPFAEAVAAVLLVGALVFATVRPGGWPEAVFAVPAALLLLAIGALSVDKAGGEARSLGPTIGFLAAVLVLADLCDRYGLFSAAGDWMARGSKGRPVALLALVFVCTSIVTAVLSLDATVVLLTPVVLATVARLRLRVGPPAYACTHLANSASLLLPVSNLTNLLAFGATGLSFGRFAEIMALPWLAAILTEWLVLRRFFAPALEEPGVVSPITGGSSSAAEEQGNRTGRAAGERASGRTAGSEVPVFAVAVVSLTLVGFFVASVVNIAPAFVAAAGAVVMACTALATRRARASDILRAVDLPFLAFVLALGLIVKALSLHGLGPVARHLLPGGNTLWCLLATAAVGALLANLINNLPALLILLPAAAGSGPANVLALLVGVNAGPNLTYFGSLATLLWRRSLAQRGETVDHREFLKLGAISVPSVLVVSSLVLWVSLKLVG